MRSDNSTRQNGDDNTSDEEKPEFQFRGFWIPADVWNLYEDGTIEMAEMILLVVIDGLVKAKGEGCWASNEVLGEKVRVSSRSVIRMIKNLKKLGLVRQTGWKVVRNLKFRILETRWSRVETRESGQFRGDKRSNSGVTNAAKEGDSRRNQG